MWYTKYPGQPGRKIGWMHGFVWTRQRSYSYDEYKQVINGDIPPQAVSIILSRLNQVTDYPEHFFDTIMKCFFFLLWIVGLIMVIVGAIQGNDDIYGPGAAILGLTGVFTVVRFFFSKIVNWRLYTKIENLVQKINKQVEIYGIILTFPLKKYMCCFCITCCGCIKFYDYETIEIWTSNPDVEMTLIKPNEGIFNSTNMQTSSMESAKSVNNRNNQSSA